MKEKMIAAHSKGFSRQRKLAFSFFECFFCSRDYCTIQITHTFTIKKSASHLPCVPSWYPVMLIIQVSRISISVLTVTISKLRNLLLIHWVKCLPIMVELRKNNIVEHVMLLCHLIKTHFPVSGSLVLISVMSTF